MDIQVKLDQTAEAGISPLAAICTDISHPLGIHRHGLARFVRRTHQRYSFDRNK